MKMDMFPTVLSPLIISLQNSNSSMLFFLFLLIFAVLCKEIDFVSRFSYIITLLPDDEALIFAEDLFLLPLLPPSIPKTTDWMFKEG